MTEKPIQLGLAGLGTVGSGVYETLCRNHACLLYTSDAADD